MKMKTKLLSLLVACTFTLVGCGGGSDPTPTPSVKPSTPTQGEVTPSVKPSTPTVEPTPTVQPSTPTHGDVTPTVQPSTPTESPSPTDEPPVVDPTNQTYYFCLDYSHSDTPLYTMRWYRGKPLGKMPDEIKDIDSDDAADPLFPIFLGWSSHTSSIDDSHLWDWENDFSNDKEVYICGIWISDEEPTPIPTQAESYTFKVDCGFMMNWNPVPGQFAIHTWGSNGEYASWGSEDELMTGDENNVYSITIEYVGVLEGAIFYYKQGNDEKQTVNINYDYEGGKTYVITLGEGDWVQNEYGVWCQPASVAEEVIEE